MLVVHGLTKSYAGPRPRAVFADVDLELSPGDYIAVMGESGVGKSTLLNLIAGLDSPDRGSIKLGDIELTTLDDDALTALRRERFGFVFQAFHVLPYLSVARKRRLAPVADRHRRAGDRRASDERAGRRRPGWPRR
jgi:putative ABC transport system ATP-binding protein